MSDEKIRIEHAPVEKVRELSLYVAAVLDALDHPEALVTDLSTVGDFTAPRRVRDGWDDERVRRYLRRLEYPLSCLAWDLEEAEYLWSAAARLRSRAELLGEEPKPVLKPRADG